MSGGRSRGRAGRNVGLTVAAAIALAAGASSFAGAVEGGTPSGDGAETNERLFIPGEVVVRFDPGASGADRAAAAESVDADSSTGLSVSRAKLVELGDGVSVREAVEELSADPVVDFAEPNYIYHQDSVPNDPFFGQLWGLNNTGQTVSVPGVLTPTNTAGTADADIDAPEAWDVAPVENGDARDVVVAIVDSGIDYEHPDLAPNMWHNPGEIPANSVDDDANGFVDDEFGFDFKNQFNRASASCTNATPPTCADADPIDDSQVNHGTHVAGTVGARGGDNYGVTGVAQRVQLMAVKVFDQLDASSNVSVANAFDYAGDNGAQVVNASLSAPCPSSLQAAAIQAHSDVLFVVSAGNLGDDNDIPDAPVDERSPQACVDPEDLSNANVHPGRYPCNFNAGPEAAGYLGPAYDFNNVMCVAASTSVDGRASFSNYGATSVQIAAPGFDTLSTQPAYATKLAEGFEDPSFDNRLADGSGNPITTATATGWRRVAGIPGLAGNFSMSESAVGADFSNAEDEARFRPATPVNLTGEVGCHIEWTHELTFPDSGDFVRLRAIDGNLELGIDQRWTGNGVFRQTPAVPELNGKTQAGWQVSFDPDLDANLGEGTRIDNVNLRCLGGSYSPAAIGMPIQGTHKFLNGTSMATPHVAGAAALMLAKAPDLEPHEVITILGATGDPNTAFASNGSTPVAFGSRLNLRNSLTFGSPAPAIDITKSPSQKTTKKKAKFEFTLNEPGTTTCKLDSEPAEACTSPHTVKVKEGKHKLTITASDDFGNVETESQSWKYKKK